MTSATRSTSRPYGDVPSAALGIFLLLSFSITWGLIGLYVLQPELAVRWLGEISGRHPVFVLAVWAPAFAAFAVVLLYGGLKGFAAFLSRLLLWRCPPAWVAFLLLGVPLTFVAGALLKGTPVLAGLQYETATGAVAAMAFMLILGPIEEFGWRGVAQPILQRHMAPIWAAILIGSIWGVWHVPAFLLSGLVQSGWDFWPFFFGNVALAVIVTPLFNVSRGSILLAMAFHYQLINPLWPDAQPYDTYAFIAIAVLVVVLNHRALFGRDSAITEVMSAAEHSRGR